MVAPNKVRPASVGRERSALLASSEKPTRLKTDTVNYQQNCSDANTVSPAGNISTTSKNRGINESGRFHLWQEVEQQFQQWQKQGGADTRRVAVGGSGVGRPVARDSSGISGDLFGRSAGQIDQVEVATTEVSPIYFESLSNGRGSGNLHSTGHLAGGISESETAMSPRHNRGNFKAQFSSRDVCRFHSQASPRTGASPRGVQPEVKEMSKHAKDACRFHYHERPARARSADVGSDARRTAGLTSAQRESRHGSGDSHGRSMTPDYHRRYEENAGGSSLPGSTGASLDFGMVASPRTTHGDPNRSSRRHGAFDPRRTGAANLSASVVARHERQGDLTASLHESRKCRYHAPPEEAAKFFRQSSQNNHVKLAADSNSQRPPTAASGPQSPLGSPAATAWRSLDSDTSRSYDPSQSFAKSTSALQIPTTPRYVPGRMDRNTARASADRLLDSRPKQAIGDIFDRGPLLSLGGMAMSQKRRLNENHVPAARMTSSPIAAEGGIWA